MAIAEQPNKFSANEPACKEFAHEAKRYFVADRVCEGTGREAIGVHPMRVLPAAKRARNLNVAKLAAFNVIAVLKSPANSERAEANAQDAAVAVVDSRRSFDDFYGLPRRCQSLKRSWFRMPAKNLLGGCFNPRLRYELNFVHCFEMRSPVICWMDPREMASYWVPDLAGTISDIRGAEAESATPIARPKPVPPYFRVVEPSAWVKASKMMSCLSFAMPIPLSLKRKNNSTVFFRNIERL